jgi:hypothetical protein
LLPVPPFPNLHTIPSILCCQFHPFLICTRFPCILREEGPRLWCRDTCASILAYYLSFAALRLTAQMCLFPYCTEGASIICQNVNLLGRLYKNLGTESNELACRKCKPEGTFLQPLKIKAYKNTSAIVYY